MKTENYYIYKAFIIENLVTWCWAGSIEIFEMLDQALGDYPTERIKELLDTYFNEDEFASCNFRDKKIPYDIETDDFFESILTPRVIKKFKYFVQ